MTSAPAPEKAPDVFYPAIPKCSLKNGLTVACVEDDYLPRISVRLALPVGRISDPTDSQGITQMVTEMLKEGTASRTSQEIAETLDQRAIDFECDVSMEHSVIAMTMLASQLESGLELLADLLCNPTFPEQEFEKVRTRWRGNLLAQRSDPAFLANERLFLEFYGSHPYSKTSVLIQHLEVFSCDRLHRFFQNQFSPRGAFLMLAGAVSFDQAVKAAERHFGGWVGKEPTSPLFPSPPELATRLFALVDRPHSAQTKVLMGVRTVALSDPAVFPLKLVNQVFGGSASARLFLNLREDKGYTYGAYSFQKNYKKDGVILATADVRTDASRDAIEEVFREADRMSLLLPDESELTRGRSEIVGSFLRQVETPGSIGSLEILRLLMDLPADYYQSYLPVIRSLTAEEVLAASKQYLDSARMLTVVVGDRKFLETQLREIGELRIYDAQGNRLE